MNQNEFRKAFDAIPFSPDFQARTERLLRECARSAEREDVMNARNFKRSGRIALVAAICAALALSVSAAVWRFTPAQVARELGEARLAEAFESANQDAQAAEILDYEVVFEGLVSGERLTEDGFLYDGQSVDKRTYAVFAINGKGGEPLPEPNRSLTELGITITPLVRGHAPWEVNIWTLRGAYETVVKEDTLYLLFSTETLEQFPAGDVYYVVYEGVSAPSSEMFTPAENGAYALNDGIESIVFTL